MRRAASKALLLSVDQARDLAAVDAHRAYEDRVGWETARQNDLTAAEVRRLLDGETQALRRRSKAESSPDVPAGAYDRHAENDR